MPPFSARSLLLTAALLPLSACMTATRAVDALPTDASPRTEAVAQLKDDLTAVPMVAAAPEPPLEFTGLGLAQVAGQPGGTLNERRLMAIRAARLEAMRDLTEQVHGLRLDAETTVSDQVVRSDRVRGIVSGEIRGARTVRITPKGNDSFEVVMALDPDTVRYIVQAVRKGG